MKVSRIIAIPVTAANAVVVVESVAYSAVISSTFWRY